MADLIEIPENFSRVLAKDAGLQGSVLITLKTFQPWLRTSGMPFFPAFTDHSDKHISEVLATASSLITDEARALMTPADVATLTLATLLHDVAMHTTQDGFRALVRQTYSPVIFEDFGDRAWPTLWAEFLGQASRFDGRQLVRIFGSSAPVDPHQIDIDNLSERDNLLIGDFLRRHHARLAHQIAISGVPGPGPKYLELNPFFEDHLRDIAGLVARSHNFSIRDAFAHLDTHYNKREFKGVRPTFLMAVLRIADYLQVHGERAERDLLKIKQLRSPVSKLEWRAHHAVRDVRATHDDPEAIFVDALPNDIQTFSKLSWLLKDMQRELDQSWAILGEVYGRVQPLDRLGLTIRRIRSTLDNPAELTPKIPYIPTHAAFEASGADLLKLLVGPLYSHNPNVAIRELIQNATDACKELNDLNKTNISTDANLPDVEVILDESIGPHGTLTVRDRGVGMTLNIIVNFFLRAGASYRHSDAWRKQHEDLAGHSRVLRGGRFGVGALAAFLLGDRINVVTRHIDAPPEQGITFSAEIDSSELELRHCKSDIGTTITIPVRDRNTWTRLVPEYAFSASEEMKALYLQDLDWYCVSNPKVRITVRDRQGNEHTLKPANSVPDPKSNLPDGWFRIDSQDYFDVHWTYNKAPALVCNGIFVTDRFQDYPAVSVLWGNQYHTPFMIKRPNLSVFDNQGILPLNLQRNELAASNLSFDKKLVENVSKDIVASLLASLPDEPASKQADSLRKILAHEAILPNRFLETLLLFTKFGVSWLEPSIIAEAKINHLWVVPSYKDLTIALPLLPESTGVIVLSGTPAPADKFRLVTSPSLFGSNPIELFAMENEMGVFTQEEYDHACRPKAVRKDLIAAADTTNIGKHLVVFGRNTTDRKRLNDFIESAKVYLAAGGKWLAQWSIAEATWRMNVAASPVAQVWARVSAKGIIPYSTKERASIKQINQPLLTPHLEYHEKRTK